MWFAWPFVVGIAIIAESTTKGFWLGIPVIVLGEAIRIWSHGYLRKTRRLATDGPYAFVRNPLYVGNYLIGLGFFMIIWNPWMVVLYTAGFIGVYWVTVKGEEQRLRDTMGKPYDTYCEHVRRFIPRFTPYAERSRAKFAAHRVWGHGELITILAINCLGILVFLRQEMYQFSNGINLMTLSLSVGLLALSMWLVFALELRKVKGKAKYTRYRKYRERVRV